jgi:hypothetical protein
MNQSSSMRTSSLSVCGASPVDPATMTYLSATCERFEKALEGLRCRVAPALRPLGPEACAPSTPMPAVSDLRARVQNFDNLVSRLVETTDQIDL